MNSYQVTLSFNGQVSERKRQVVALSADSAMDFVVKQESSPIHVGTKRAAARVADGDGWFTQDGACLVPTARIQAVCAERMREHVGPVQQGTFITPTGDVTYRA
jgi:hypothetical protein